MTFTLTIEMDNAAFEDVPAAELVRILRELANDFDNGRKFPDSGTARDVNGNTVARFQVTE